MFTEMDREEKRIHELERENRFLRTIASESANLGSIGVLSRTVAHDLNNIIGTITGNAELAAMLIDNREQVTESLEFIENAGMKAAAKLRGLLDFSVQTTQCMIICDLHGILRDVVSFMLPEHKNIQISFDLLESDVSVAATTSLVVLLVRNLLLNSLEAYGETPGTISVATSLKEMDQTALDGCKTSPKTRPGKYLAIEVRDQAGGILDQKTLEHCVDPFFTTKKGRAGLGLATVYGILRTYRGALKLNNNTGEGLAILCLLPL